MKIEYENGVIDHTVFLKKRITDRVVHLLAKAQSDNILANYFENPTEEDYEILEKVTCDLLACEIWAATEMEHFCEDCFDDYTELICERFWLYLQLDQKYDPIRIIPILHYAAGAVAFCSSRIQDEFYEAFHPKAEEIGQNGSPTEGKVAVQIVGGDGANDQPR